MPGFTKQNVIDNALNWGLGISDNGKFTVVVYCSDGILVLNGGSGSSGSGSSGAGSSGEDGSETVVIYFDGTAKNYNISGELYQG